MDTSEYFKNFEDEFSNYLPDSFSYVPFGKYIHVVLVRKTLSEVIFRTDEVINVEETWDSLYEPKKRIGRVVMSKRKQVAPERRTGREFLRKFGIISNEKGKANTCKLNESPCGKCPDCMIYGYAVDKSGGVQGAQKSRVFTENAYSILESEKIVDVKTFNAIYDTGTMKNEEGMQSEALGENEYVKPGTHFMDIETFKDLSSKELLYVLNNLISTHRYGAISSRIGKMKNIPVAIIASNSEIFGALELAQYIYEKLIDKDHPLKTSEVLSACETGVSILMKDSMPLKIWKDKELKKVFGYVVNIVSDEKFHFSLLEDLTNSYPTAKAGK